MSTRRRFMSILPLAGVSLVAACSDKAAPPPPPPTPEPAAPAAPAPAPVDTTASGAAPAATGTAGAMVDPADPQAVTLGYVADAAQVDAAKYPAHVAGQACGNCALFAGKPGDASGPCPLFAGKQVNAKGWCSAYNKKA